MRIWAWIPILASLGLGLLVLGCEATVREPSPAAETPPSPTVSQVPTLQAPTPTPTRVVAGPRTPTPYPAYPSREKTPPLTPLATSLPTLPPDEKQAYLTDLLTSNDGCDFPCWWGMTPGSTSLETSKHIFEPLGAKPYFMQSKEGVTWHMIGIHTAYAEPGNSALVIDVFERETVVQISVNASPGRATPEARGALRVLSIPEILSDYGMPSSVLLGIMLPLEPYTPVFYNVSIHYEHLGFAVGYSGEAELGDVVAVCPAYDLLSRINLHLRSPGDTEFLRPNALWGLPLESVTDMDLEAFYDAFIASDQDECIHTPRSTWE